MRIGELALVTGVNPQTLRFYERQGLLAPAKREANGYRHYDQTVASHIRFIRGAQAVGMTLADIKGILIIRQDGMTPCEHVTALLVGRLEDVRSRQRELALMETELQNLIDTSRDLDPADCTAGSVCQIIPTHIHRLRARDVAVDSTSRHRGMENIGSQDIGEDVGHHDDHSL